VFALKLPDEMSSLFIADASVGFAIVVNFTRDAVRHRWPLMATPMPFGVNRPVAGGWG
jgi:hypothetical protein